MDLLGPLIWPLPAPQLKECRSKNFCNSRELRSLLLLSRNPMAQKFENSLPNVEKRQSKSIWFLSYTIYIFQERNLSRSMDFLSFRCRSRIHLPSTSLSSGQLMSYLVWGFYSLFRPCSHSLP